MDEIAYVNVDMGLIHAFVFYSEAMIQHAHFYALGRPMDELVFTGLRWTSTDFDSTLVTGDGYVSPPQPLGFEGERCRDSPNNAPSEVQKKGEIVICLYPHCFLTPSLLSYGTARHGSHPPRSSQQVDKRMNRVDAHVFQRATAWLIVPAWVPNQRVSFVTGDDVYTGRHIGLPQGAFLYIFTRLPVGRQQDLPW